MCRYIGKKKKTLEKNQFQFIKADITKKKDLFKLKKIFSKQKNNIDCLINCSYPKKNQIKNYKTSYNDLSNIISSHIVSSIILCEIILDIFKKQKKGNILLFGSIQGVMAPKFHHYKDLKMTSPVEYTAIKHSLVGITKYYAKLYGPKKININMISPGGIKNNQSQKFIKRYRKDCLSKGMLDPKDLITTVDYLLNKNSRLINGQNIIVDDGWSL